MINNKIKNLLLNYIFCIILFSLIYSYLFHLNKNHFNGAEDYQDIIYFTTTTQASIGYGDITPKSKLCKWIVIMQHISITLLIIHVFYCFLC
jgi:hypothetical protein